MSLSDFWTDLDRRAEQARQPAPKPKREPAMYRAMTAEEQALARALGRCSFSVGSFDKRFARDISTASGAQEPRITEKQAALQGLPAELDGKPLALAGRSVSRWRERIGNAVPVQAGTAIADTLLTALLAAALGTWTLGSTGIWVRDDGRTETELEAEIGEAA